MNKPDPITKPLQENDNPQLFLLSYIQVAQKFRVYKEIEKKQHKKNIEKKKGE